MTLLIESDSGLIQNAMEKQAKKLEYNRLYMKNRLATDPEFKLKVNQRAIANTKYKYANDPEYKEKIKQYQKERYKKHKELVAKGVEMAKNNF